MVNYLQTLPGRSLDESSRQQVALFQEASDLTGVLDALPHFVLVFNLRRQLVFANQRLVDLLEADGLDELYGRPPGELLDCPNAFKEFGGCGSTEACEGCGANVAFEAARQGDRSCHECRIIQRTSGRAIDVRVAATPMKLGGDSFTMLVLTDISHEKRRQALERIFFHDLLNVATGVVGFSLVLKRTVQTPVGIEAAESISRLVRQLADEIKAQRALSEAESGELQPWMRPVWSGKILQSVVQGFRGHALARERHLIVDAETADVEFKSDELLLSRVLINLVKNALEATRPGQQVTVGCRADEASVAFWVHNPGEMTRDAQLQVFQRSFSTKGIGRGLGTYSIKLLTEQYLKGRAWFTSNAEAGTTFNVSYPR